jgi:IS5 family transposase
MLAHPEESLFADGRALSDLVQGVTLEVIGEGSMGPLTPRMKQLAKQRQSDIHYDVDWTTFGEYMEKLQRRGIAPNVASFVGAGTVRSALLGESDVQPTSRQLNAMKALVRQAMEEGALGLTTALIYSPNDYAKTPELIAPAGESARCGGIYSAHMRSEGDRIFEAVQETIQIARASGAPAEIYHLRKLRRTCPKSCMIGPNSCGSSRMNQQTLAGFEKYGKTTRRAPFLAEMEQVVPWKTLCALIEPFYPKGGNGEGGRPPVPLERMLRIPLLQLWFNLSEPAVEEALYDSAAVRQFAGIDLGHEAARDETTVCKFRHLVEKHKLGEVLFKGVNRHLHEQGIKVSRGTIVEASIISAPSSVADSLALPHLLHGKETRVSGDQAYRGQAELIRQRAPRAKDFTNRRYRWNGQVDEIERRKNRIGSKIRSRVEHAFWVIKGLFGFAKVRYRGLAKNLHRLPVTCALANLFMVRRRLLTG